MGSAYKLGTVTLMGSGELADSMARVHRSLLAKVASPVQAVFLDTPAGFELNADEISAKAVEYFKQRFDADLSVASFKSQKHATAVEIEAALRKMYRAGYIFAGPGSPSYAVHNWQGSPLWDMLVTRLMDGAQLVFASAAAVAVGSWSLPVYEIYKAGDDPHWLAGLNLLAPAGLALAVVPHWNNAEGETYDTRYCYMGESRFRQLEAQLPPHAVILGIDEYTACQMDVAAAECTVHGAGQVTVRHDGRETAFPSGAQFSFDVLRGGEQVASDPTSPDAQLPAAAGGRGHAPLMSWPAPDPELQGATLYLTHLAKAIEEASEPEAQRGLVAQAHEVLHHLSAAGPQPADGPPAEESTPYIEMLIAVRAQLRTAKQYALADYVRQQLGARGLQIEDTPAGTTWKRAAQ